MVRGRKEDHRNGEGIGVLFPAAMTEITRPSAVPGGRWSGLSLVHYEDVRRWIL